MVTIRLDTTRARGGTPSDGAAGAVEPRGQWGGFPPPLPFPFPFPFPVPFPGWGLPPPPVGAGGAGAEYSGNCEVNGLYAPNGAEVTGNGVGGNLVGSAASAAVMKLCQISAG